MWNKIYSRQELCPVQHRVDTTIQVDKSFAQYSMQQWRIMSSTKYNRQELCPLQDTVAKIYVQYNVPILF